MAVENVSQQAGYSQPPTQPSSPPESHLFLSRKKQVWVFLILTVLVVIVIAGILGKDFLLNLLLNKQTTSLSKPYSKNKSIEKVSPSILYSINKEDKDPFNNNYNLVAKSSATYISHINKQNSQPVSIGYNSVDLDGRSSGFEYQTTENGKYLIRYNRSNNEKIEIAPADNPSKFTTLFTPTNTKLSHYFIVSQDNTKLIVKDGDRIAIVDLANPSKIIYVSPPKSESTDIIGFDTNLNQLYYHPYILTIDNQGNILNSKKITDYDFIVEFTKDFQYAFYDKTYLPKNYKINKHSIFKHNLQTGENTILVDLPGELVQNLKLSPTEDKLFFIDDTITNINYLYIIDLASNKTDRIAINAGIKPTIKNYISPDGKYLQLYNSQYCGRHGCTDDQRQNLIFDVEQKKFFVLHQPIGNKEANQNDSNSPPSIETMTFLGWLVKEKYSKPTSITLPLFDLQQALATPTPNLSSGEYPLMQIDLSKNKYFIIQANSIKYPDEILNADPSNLIGMKCTQRFVCDQPYDSCWSDIRPGVGFEDITEKDPKFVKMVKEAAQSINSARPEDQLANVTYCQTEDGDAILEYQALGNGNRSTIELANGTDYVGFAPANGAFRKVATIETQSDQSCSSPIMLTKDFHFYITCNASEGRSIQKIDLRNATQQKLISCSNKTYTCQ